MAALAPILTSKLFVTAATAAATTAANEFLPGGRRDQQKQAVKELQQSQALGEKNRAEDVAREKEKLRIETGLANKERQEALRRAVSRQRANFSAQGVGAGAGSSQAVLLGLFEESDDEREKREALDNLRFNALDQNFAQGRSLNVLQRTQLEERNKVSQLSSANKLVNNVLF